MQSTTPHSVRRRSGNPAGGPSAASLPGPSSPALGPRAPAASAFGAAPAALLGAITGARAKRWGLAWLLPLALLGAWSLASRRGWVPDQILPAPEAVWQVFTNSLRSGELLDNLRISLLRVLGGFAVGTGIGLPLGLAMGLSPTLKDYLAPSFKAFAQVPVLGWLPFLMLLVGIDETLKVLLIAKATLVPVVLNTLSGVENVPPRALEVARVLKFNRLQLLSKVVIPSAFAPIWTGVRYGFTNAWLALVVVELLASSEGLGFMIVYGRQLFQLDVVLAAVLAVGIVGFVLDKGLALVEARLTRWRRQGF